jgi:hypothetical protein
MCILLLPVCLLFSLVSIGRAVEVPAVPIIADAEAFAVVVVPDLKAALGRLDQALAAAKLPVPPGLIAKQLGMKIKDPTLAGLGAGPIIIAVAPGVPIPSWCAIVPMAKPAALQQLAADAGLSAEAVPGGFAIGSMMGGLELAKRLAPGLPALAKGIPAGTDFRILVASDRLAKTYLPLALGGIQMAMAQSAAAGGKPAGPEQQRAMQAALTAVRLLFEQAGPLCIDLASSARGWKVDVLAAPAPGVLADSLKPLPAAAGADLGARLGAPDQPPVMAMVGRFPPALYAGMARLLEAARKDPGIATMIDASLVKAMDGCASAFDGRLAMRQGVAGNPLQQLAVMGVKDATGLRQVIAASMALFEKGVFADLLASSGMRLKLERAMRKAGAVEVDRMLYEIIPEVRPPGQAKMMQAMLQPIELAVAKDIFAFGGPSTAIDALLAGPAAQPLVLAAQSLPGQWDLRADWDLALQMKYQFEMMRAQMPMVPQMFTDVKGGVPVRVGIAFGAGRVRTVAEVPAALIAQLAASRMVMMSPMKSNGVQPVPEPGPAPAPATF